MNKLLMKGRLIVSCIAMMIAMLILPLGLNAKAESADEVTEYTVTFVSIEGGFYDVDGNSSGTKTVTVKAGEKIGYVPDPYDADNGSLFTGWYKDSNREEIIENVESFIPEDNMTLYAGFRDVSADTDAFINLDFNGGKTSGTKYIKEDDVNGKWYINPGKKFESIGALLVYRENHAFTGWYLDANCTEKVTSDTVLNNGDTIYAGWTREYYSITLNAGEGYFNGDVAQKTDTTNISVGVNIYLGAYLNGNNNTYTNDGKIITGWYEDKELTKEVALINGDYTPTDDVTFYAKWEKGVKVTFDYKIAAEEYASDDYIHTAYHKKGQHLSNWQDMQGKTFGEYVFDGWYLDEECSTRYVSSFYDYTLVEDVTFYAKWSTSVAVTYEAGSGHFFEGETSKTVYIPKGEYIQIGYTAYNNDKSKAFIGWSLNENATSKDAVIEKDIIAAENNVTLYAVYTDGYQITFDGNDGIINYYYEYMNGSYWSGRYVDSEKYILTIPQNVTARSYEYIELYSVDANLPNTSGKHLFGWSTSQSAENVIDFDTYKFDRDTTLYAIWGDECKVTLDTNGGHFYSGDTTLTEDVAVGKSLGRSWDAYIDDPNKLFKNWNTKADGTGEEIESLFEFIPNGDTTLYAQYDDAWTITYDANGGYFVNTESNADKTYVVKTLRNKEIYAGGNDRVKNNDSSKAIVGWSTDQEGKDILVNAETSFTPTKSMTLYAVWKDGYKVRYHANSDGGYFIYNGVSVTDYEITVPAGESLNSFPYPEFVNNDDKYIYKSYNTKADGSGVNVDSGYVLTGDIDLYVQWEKAYTITYNANGGYFEQYNNIRSDILVENAAAGSTNYLGTFRDLKNSANKAFIGWSTTADGKNLIERIDKVDNNITLYAVWEDGYVITFDGNGGKVSFSAWSYDSALLSDADTKTFSKNKPVAIYEDIPGLYTFKEGYILTGWSLTSDGSKMVSLNSYIPTEDITFYAMWEKAYTVKFDANGGYLYGNASETEYETKIKENDTIYFPTASSDEYALVGWNTSRDGNGTEVTTDMKVTSDMTVYAIWAKGYKVTINAGKGKVNRYGNIGIVNTYFENVAKGKEILLPIREEVIWSDEGYIYGWYEDENFQKPIYIINSDNEADYYPYYPTKDITLYAKFVSGEDKVKVTEVALSKTKATIGVGDSLELNAVIKPSNATNNAVSFTSSNTDVATVDETGKVVAVAAGKAVITVTTEDGKFTAECDITVDGQNTKQISDYIDSAVKILQDNATEDQIKKTVNDTLSSMGSAEVMADKVESNGTVADKLKELEDAYTEAAKVEVVDPKDDPNTQNALKEVFGNEVNTTVASVSGAGLNAAPNQVAKLDITPIAEDDKKDVEQEGFNSVAQIDMTLKVGDAENAGTELHELVAPITITLPLPKTINSSKLYVLHYYSDGTYELIKPVLSKDSMTITVWRFSTFAIVEVADGEAINNGNGNGNQNPTHTPGTGGSGGQTQNPGGSGNSGQSGSGNDGQPQSGNGDQNSDGNNTQNPGSGNDEQSQNPGTGNGEQSQNPGTGNDGQSQNPGTGNSGQSQGGSSNQNTGNTSGSGNNAQNPTGNGANSGNTGAQTPVENQEGNVNAGDNGGQSQNGSDDKTSSGADVTAIPETTDNSVKEVDDPTKAKIISNKEEISVSKIKKKDQKVTVKVERSKGKITAKNVSSKKLKKYLTVKVKGKKVICTVKKGAPKGTYKVKITVAKKGKIKKTTKTIEIVVK
ncbi:InlB B-repeat-containing protein [Butyrivibrio sp. LC3010]|uniref:InlB B-repeat-containing protein n=1 Tax=Butyrivibrio sp. LC3010 TaxID=1280680 RepID=UPI0003F64984|nr:InlB B-repeat-containing protein [Butyrivibrio sp. LC3010]